MELALHQVQIQLSIRKPQKAEGAERMWMVM
jgi:hypothetical protein